MTKLHQPAVNENFYVTLNAMGYMFVTPDRFNQAFIDYAIHADHPVLDIGAAYGLATIPALEGGAQVVANDLDKHHLAILESKVSARDAERLTIVPGEMPYDLSFPNNYFDAILASRCLNFVHPKDLDHCFQLIYKWLRPGGKFFYLGATPFMGTFSKFFAQYETNKEQDKLWPGFMEDVQKYAPQRAHDLPDCMNLIDEDLLTKMFQKNNFTIEIMDYLAAEKNHPDDMKYDGREHLGAIAIKNV